MHTSLSKKLLAGLLSLVMVLSLVAPSISSQAATQYSLTDKKSVKSGYTFKYELKGVSKGCYVKVTRNVSGEKVVYNKKELTKTTKVNGTGKTLNLYVTYGEKDENYTGKFTVRVYGKKTNKLYKTLVEEVTVKVPEKEEPEVEELKVSLKQTGSKELTATLNKEFLLADVELTVKKGNTTVGVKSSELTEAKDGVVLTLATAITANEYTVTAKLGEETASATVMGEASKLAEIKFPSLEAVIASATAASFTVLGYNQFGESVALTSATVSTSNGTGSTPNTAGLVNLSSPAVNYTAGSKITVTVMQGTVVKTETLTLVNSATVASIEFGELENTSKTYANEKVNVTNFGAHANSYYRLPVTIKDTYGNVLTAAVLNAQSSAKTLMVSSSDTNVANVKAYNSNPFVSDADGNVYVDIQKGTTQTYGTATISVVTTSGVVGNGKVVVDADPKLDVISLDGPTSELKCSTPAVFAVSMNDTYENAIDLYQAVRIDQVMTISGTGTATLTFTYYGNANTTITSTGATLDVKYDYAKKVLNIIVTPTSSAKSVTLTAVSTNGKVATATYSVSEEPEPTTIYGAYVSGLDYYTPYMANDGSLSTNLAATNVVFLDQYGDATSTPVTYVTSLTNSGFEYTVDQTIDNGATTFTATGAVITAKAITEPALTDTYTIKLYKDGVLLDIKTVDSTVVNMSKINSFEVDDLNMFYANGESATTHDQTIAVYGIYSGEKVLVNQSIIVGVVSSNADIVFDSITTFDASASTLSGGSTVTKDVTLTVYIENQAANSTSTITKDIKVSNAAPIATTAVCYDVANYENVSDTVVLDHSNIASTKTLLKSSATSGLRLSYKDQYGVEMTAGYTYKVTNINSSAVTAQTISSEGVFDAPIGGAWATGDSFTIICTKDAMSQQIKVVLE